MPELPTLELPTLKDVRAAAARVAPVIFPTPLLRLPLPGAVYAKPENLQRTNSFKLRGAYNFLAALPEAVRARGVTAHSSGNHAQGVACAAHLFGVSAAIAIPEDAAEVKVARTRAWGAEVVRCGGASAEREAAAQRLVAERGYTLVPPFDHPWIIAGQGTVGLELAEEMPEVANVLVPVGGGGLIAGVALALKALRPGARLIGVEPELAADAHESFARGERVAWSAEQTGRTVADGVRTQQLGRLNFELIRRHVDAIVTVSDGDILEAAAWYLHEAKLVVEPTGALTLAAYRQLADTSALNPGPTALVISGGNLEPARLATLTGL